MKFSDRRREMTIATIAIILVIATLTILAISFRRKYTKIIKELEHEKLQIQHKPIFEEMMKIKQLNMTGETEEKFEKWRSTWNDVIDVTMPNIDHLLFDAEEQIDYFKIKPLKETIAKIEKHIQESDMIKDDILEGLDTLIGSEEKNRIEMEKIQERFKAARKKVLAHQPAYGLAVSPLEKELESFLPQFEAYEELTENGNYLQAREMVLALHEKANTIFTMIDEIPQLLSDVQTNIPNAIRELRNGIREMKDQAYYIDHLKIDEQLKKMEETLEQLRIEIGALTIEGAKETTTEMLTSIDAFYDALEKEVYAKHFVEQHFEPIDRQLDKLLMNMESLMHEVLYVQQSYRIPEEESKKPEQLKKEIEAHDEVFEMIAEQLENHSNAYSVIEEQMKEIQNALEHIEVERQQYNDRLKNLRNDENEVRKQVAQLEKMLGQIDRTLHKENIPGIPADIDARMDEADEQIFIVKGSLEEVPLNISLVHAYLENAKTAVTEVKQKVEELVENVMIVEYIIQYGNRYRRSDGEIHRQLLEAEASFRQFRYAKALEEAATAVEAAEPGAMKKIEQIIQENEGHFSE